MIIYFKKIRLYNNLYYLLNGVIYLNKKIIGFSQNLKTLRKKKYLTGIELAKKLNVSHSTLASWETGRHFPHIEDIIKIADFFEISIDELLGRDYLNIENIKLNYNPKKAIILNEFYNTLAKDSEITEQDIEDLKLIFDYLKTKKK